jgi:hypothetical protein
MPCTGIVPDLPYGKRSFPGISVGLLDPVAKVALTDPKILGHSGYGLVWTPSKLDRFGLELWSELAAFTCGFI